MPPTTVGPYALVKELGRGPFATLWQATDSSGETVAIKLFNTLLAEETAFNAALRREVRNLASLRHPGIRRYLDLVIEPGHTALVLEYQEGQDLGERMRARRLSLPQVVRTLQAILEPLASAHAERTPHWDLRPSNIFLTSAGEVRLLDFSLLPLIEATRAVSIRLINIPVEYMAPERFTGQGGPSADVYAAGLVAWEMVVGRRACPVTSPIGQANWHRREGAPDVRILRSDCPVGLADLIRRMTDASTAYRLTDAAEALDLLQSQPSLSDDPDPILPIQRLPDREGIAERLDRLQHASDEGNIPFQDTAPPVDVLPDAVQEPLRLLVVPALIEPAWVRRDAERQVSPPPTPVVALDPPPLEPAWKGGIKGDDLILPRGDRYDPPWVRRDDDEGRPLKPSGEAPLSPALGLPFAPPVVVNPPQPPAAPSQKLMIAALALLCLIVVLALILVIRG